MAEATLHDLKVSLLHTFCDSVDEDDNPGCDSSEAFELLSQFPEPAAIKDIKHEYKHSTLLHYACSYGWSDVVRLLVEEYQCDPTSQNTRGETPLHYACRSGKLSIVDFLVKEKHCSPAVRNAVGETPLHWACDFLEIVKYFIVVCEQDPSPVDKFGETPLHFACDSGCTDVVKYLVMEHNCNPLQKNSRNGCSPMQLACECAHFGVISFLLSSGKVDVTKQLDTTCFHAQTVNLLQKFADCRKRNPFHPTFKVFIMGNPGAGKSTLVKAIQSRMTATSLLGSFSAQFKKVSGVEPRTAGIIPVHIESEKQGNIIMYDLAGQYQYYSSHAALLEKLVSSPDALLMIVVDLSESKEEIVRTLHYWNSFIENHCRQSASASNLSTVIVGSHADVVQKSQKEKLDEKLSGVVKSLAISCLHSNSNTITVLDCTQMSSSGLKQICEVIETHCVAFHGKFELDLRLHFLYYLISEHFRGSTACRQGQIELRVNQMRSVGAFAVSDPVKEEEIERNKGLLEALIEKKTQTSSENLRRRYHVSDPLYYYPGRDPERKLREQMRVQVQKRIEHTKEVLSDLRKDAIVDFLPDDDNLSHNLTTLSEKGQFLYLRNSKKLEDSWLILDQEVLLSEVSGTIFAPENFKEHHDISSSTGVVPLSKICETFPNHDPEMIISFLTHLEFCQEIAESEASMIRQRRLRCSQPESEVFYFFPALVSEDRPKESCKSIEQTHYKCAWNLQCIRSDQFLSPRFLHILLLRLAFSFALAAETAEEEKACPVLRRKCNVWKAGIQWQNRDGVEAIVEVVNQNTAVTLMMGCLEGREMACARLQSEVIHTILHTRERFCGAVELRESLVHPAELSSYPLKSPKLLISFTIPELATAIAEDKPVVTHKLGHEHQMLGISKLLYFEPYACFNPALLSELFDKDNAEKEIVVRFLSEIGETTYPKKNEFMTALKVPLRLLHDKAPPNCRDNPAHISMLVFRAWKASSPTPTYQALRSALDKFSVFCGRDPLLLAGQVPSPQSSVDCTAVGGKAKPKLTRTSHGQRATTEDVSTSPQKNDRPRLQELQCLRGRGGRRVKVIEGVAAHWEDLALALNFESSVIEIVRRNTFHQTEDACREMLQRWLEGQEETRQPVNWATLTDSLLEAGFVDLAEDLQEVVEDPLLSQN